MSDAASIQTVVRAADADGIAAAIALLRAGQPVALPTETVYGLAADATDAQAVARIYAAKRRPSFNPLIAHVLGIEDAAAVVEISAAAERLMRAFWPGPLTLVLPMRDGSPVASLVAAGLPTLAVRAPAHPVIRAVIEALGRPIAAPSANASGRISPTRAAHVKASLDGRVPLILDGGACALGLESTIVAVEPDRLRLLRPGPLPADAIAAAAGLGFAAVEPGRIEAPGQLASHYAPAKPLRLDAVDARTGEWLIGFGAVAGDETLSAGGDLVEAAARLFDALHRADAAKARSIAVAPIPADGIGAAIHDRLRRAAAPVPRPAPMGAVR